MRKSAKSLELSRMGLLILFLSLGLAGMAWGQTYSGSLTGVVTDPSGAVISGAKSTLTDVGRNIEFSATTDIAGRYVIRALPPSTYRLKVEAKGFSTYVQDDIMLAVNQNTSIDVQLQVGATTQTVEVIAAPALLATQDAATGQELNRTFINELPLLGRGVFDLSALAPGVTQVSGGYIGGGLANNFISNGGRNATADIIADGVTTTNFEQNTGIQTPMMTPSVDSVQEFKLQQSNFSAEIGFSGSTIINMVTRSGTNQFHGTGWEFVRNNILTANDWFANAAGIKLAPRHYNLFGANLGGPIRKDKTFFFFNYEGVRDIYASSYTAGVPSAAMRTGNFGEFCKAGFDSNGLCQDAEDQLWDPYSGVYDVNYSGAVRTRFIPFNRMDQYQSPGHPSLLAAYQLAARPGNLLDPVSHKMMQFFPLPNTKVGSADYDQFNNWAGASSGKAPDNKWDAKIDHSFSDKNRISGKFSWDHGLGISPNAWGNVGDSAANGNSKNKAYLFSLNHNYSFSPNTLLSTSFGWARNRFDREDITVTMGYDPTAELGLPKYTELSMFRATPAIYLENYKMEGVLATLGSQPWGIMRQATETWHLMGTLSQLRGRHELKIGGEGRLHRLNYAQPGAPNGVYVFGKYVTSQYPTEGGGDSMASFLTGLGTGSGGGFYEVPVLGATQSFQFAGFIQDSWKANDKLTLNLGLRYDLNLPRTERFNRGSYWDPTLTSAISVPGVTLPPGAVAFLSSTNRTYFGTDRNNFGPRFGFAYKLNEKTVMRGGYGVFYSIVITGASGVGNGFQGFSMGTSWQTSWPDATKPEDIGVVPWGRMSDPFPKGILMPKGSADGAKSFLGDNFWGPTKMDIQTPTPYEQTWSFGFQREMPGGIVLEANYVGKKGTKLYFGGSGDLNHLGPEIESLTEDQVRNTLLNPVPNPFYSFLPDGVPMKPPTISAYQLMRPYPQYAGVNLLTLPEGSSIYHAFQLRAEKRFSKGLQFLAAYTAQKSIDDSSVAHGGTTWLGGSTSLLDPNNRRLERSLSQFDIPQVLNLSYIYELPIGRGKAIGKDWNPIVNAILGGWKTSAIWRFSKGQPIGLGLAVGENLPTYGYQRPNLVGTLLKTSNDNFRDQYFANPEVIVQPAPFALGTAPRTIGSVRTPGINNANLSLLKEFFLGKIREGMRLEYRAEFFNAFNHPLFGGPNTTFGSDSFGKVYGLAGPVREVQMALKLYW